MNDNKLDNSNIIKTSDLYTCLKDEPLSKHTSFRIGGPSRYFYDIKQEEGINKAISESKELGLPYYVLGNGSNLLFKDEGFEGSIIYIGKGLDYIRELEQGDSLIVEVGAGTLLSKTAKYVADKSYTGMEFAAGIPGTLGGAVVMNAGAYGGEMKDIIVDVRIMNEDGTINKYTCEQMEFGYRKSIVKPGQVVLSATIRVEKGNQASISDRMKELATARREKQPLEYPSAGSTFKRPEGYFAGKLIEDSGLKGYRVGGAMVSEKHAGFVINYDNATCSDVLTLIDDVKRIVNEKFGVILEPEVKII